MTTERWFELAAEDLVMAEYALSREIFRQACFHAQQAVEKALKGFLAVRRGTHPKSHSLEQLLLLDESNELAAWMTKCTRLDAFYLPTRYADALPDPAGEPGPGEAAEAVRDARMIVADIRGRLG
jgi:HEPN domain-containing protein